MDPNLAVGVLALLVAIYHAYHARKHTMILEAQNLPRAARRRGEVPTISWWKLPTIPTLIVLVALAWIPWVLSQFEDKPLKDKSFEVYEGLLDETNNKFTKLTLYVSFDGNSLPRRLSSHKLIAVALHYLGNKDVDDIDDLEKSSQYYAKPEKLTLQIPVGGNFLDELNRGLHGTSYFLVAIPKDVADAAFSTLHQAKAIGATIIQIGAGPP